MSHGDGYTSPYSRAAALDPGNFGGRIMRRIAVEHCGSEASKHLVESALFADFHRCDMFHSASRDVDG